MVDVIVTTAGGVEEDLIKCMGHTYVGDFQFKGERESLAWMLQPPGSFLCVVFTVPDIVRMSVSSGLGRPLFSAF
jgi:hypothetical protein